MTTIQEITNRASYSRIADQLRSAAEEKANSTGGYLAGVIKSITVSDRAPSRNPAADGWVEMTSAADVPGIKVISTAGGIHPNIPRFQYRFSREHPNKGIQVHIKTATLGGRSKTWMRPC